MDGYWVNGHFTGSQCQSQRQICVKYRILSPKRCNNQHLGADKVLEPLLWRKSESYLPIMFCSIYWRLWRVQLDSGGCLRANNNGCTESVAMVKCWQLFQNQGLVELFAANVKVCQTNNFEPGAGKMLEPSSSEEEDEDYMPPNGNYGQTLEPPGVCQNSFSNQCSLNTD